MTKHAIRLKRAYDPPSPDDGVRVLVDRLWPRGVRKADAAIDLWMKEIAPSSGLRIWYDHDPARWERFSRAYRKELADHLDLQHQLLELAEQGTLTLVFSAKDTQHANAVVLKSVLEATRQSH